MGAIYQKQTRGRTFSLGYERDKNGKAGYYMPFASFYLHNVRIIIGHNNYFQHVYGLIMVLALAQGMEVRHKMIRSLSEISQS